MSCLLKTVETYRFDDENTAETFLREARNDSRFELSKYSIVKKEIKEKGEIIDTYYKMELTKLFNNEKVPDKQIEIDYNVM